MKGEGTNGKHEENNKVIGRREKKVKYGRLISYKTFFIVVF
jgi:hypothetical protein